LEKPKSSLNFAVDIVLEISPAIFGKKSPASNFIATSDLKLSPAENREENNKKGNKMRSIIQACLF
jgi:hypothetical protein